MRADRLVAVLLLLQAKGKLTAAEVARELEISERTARRDLEALGMAGIPVYSQAGRGGGWALAGGARTDLSGLTAAEARTLFMVAGPSSAATPEIKSALRKLMRALPEPFRADAEAAASAIVLDPASWNRTRPQESPHLDVLQRAVVDRVQVRLRYAGRERPETERLVHPLGLVSKGWAWYLVADTDAGLRTFRLSRIREVTLTQDRARRPEGFDLAETWASIVDEVDGRRTWVHAVARTDAEAVGWLRAAFGDRISVPDEISERTEVELRSWTVASLAHEIAPFGARVEIIDPAEVRAELARLGAELAGLYGR